MKQHDDIQKVEAGRMRKSNNHKKRSMKSIDQMQEELIKEFADLNGNLETTMLLIIQKGKQLPLLREMEKTDKYLIKGCHSKVWLKAYLSDNTIMYKGDSNTAITKGLISLLITIFNGQPIQSIINAKLYFLHRLCLERFVGKQRSLGLGTMVEQMKCYAMRLKHNKDKNRALQLS